MKLAVALVAVAGCTPSPEETVGPAIESIQAENLHQAAVQATTRSVPRADWPCGATGNAGKSKWTFEYGALQQCTLPITVHTSAIVGCPTKLRIAVTADDGTTTTNETSFRYEGGRLLQDKITWKDGLAVAWDNDEFLAGTNGVGTFTDTFQSDWTIRDGKLLEFVGRSGPKSALPLSMTMRLSWQGTRLLSLANETSMGSEPSVLTLDYTCKPS
ncbi:MAG: hypothetical protein ABI867_40540 [Kofleriaceae bacterium]